jgi:hypothetical protein
MPVLSPDLRNSLERTITQAREAAEAALKAALHHLGVQEASPHPSLSEAERALRRRLREELRRLGSLELLIAEGAYEHWHQMLFARFLAENHLLIHPEYRQPVSLQDCKELAHHEGDRNAWATATRYASRMLPGIFRPHDPLLHLRLAPESLGRLQSLLESIPQVVFTSDDGLGWIYQFWQSKRKAQVNKSGRKIGGADLSPVTQLFTEHYMVEFLLHNTLGAWWASRHPESPLNPRFSYLRRRQDSTPAAGSFAGWPRTARDLKILDPCCGSGHFLVAAAELLAAMRSEEEGLSLREAFDAVLRDNLYGLELDPRCTQIAAFNLALQAWKTGGYRELPVPHLACSGLAVGASKETWQKLAPDNANLRLALGELWELFKKAPDLGSLIDPGRVAVGGDLLSVVNYHEVEHLLNKALASEKASPDPTAEVFGEAARGVARAAAILREKYHLVTTNVPYLARGKQGDTLKEHIERSYPLAKADLATAFVERCRDFSLPGGSYALVTPQNWLFLGSYKKLREGLLKTQSWSIVAKLGEGGFQSPQAAGAFVALLAITNAKPKADHIMTGLDVSDLKTPADKARGLLEAEVKGLEQAGQLKNPDARVILDTFDSTTLLGEYALSWQGIKSSDDPRFTRNFWEVISIGDGWKKYLRSSVRATYFGGREQILFWENGFGQLASICQKGASFRGKSAWGKRGIAVSMMRGLEPTIYLGELFSADVTIIEPRNALNLLSLWAYCSSKEFSMNVRKVDKSLKATNTSFVKIPFDLEYWTKVAQEQYPGGLPEPYSNDPTQWLFKGSVTDATEPLLVAVARLLGYRWPEQVDDGLPEDADGIVCLPAVAGELPAADRLRALLARAYGGRWSATLEQALLASVGFEGQSLEEWLRDGFFVRHCKVFHHRPFIWHVWDGRKDGFSALLNYHQLDRAKLEKLIYTYLGAYISAQEAAAKRDERGADLRLVAALELKKRLVAILHGEPPFDIFVRWKPLHQQPIGWEPDLNDGARLNIRPWVRAGVLRARFTINWNKDRGTDPKPNASGTTERLNDLHLTRQQKEEARRQAGAA